MAWLRAVPDDGKKTRLETRQDRKIPLDIPPIDGFENIASYLSQLGYSRSGVNGMEPLSYSDVLSWSQISGVSESWVLALIVTLSREYVHQSRDSAEKNCPAPHTRKATVIEEVTRKKDIDDKIRKLF